MASSKPVPDHVAAAPSSRLTCSSSERDPDNKYTYEVDFSTALRTARKYFLRDTLTKPVDIIRLLCKYVYAVKEEFRLFPRNLRGIGAIRFNYR